MELGSLAWVLQALFGGALGYIGNRILQGIHNKLDSLRKKPIDSRDEDLEELLDNLVEELSQIDELTTQDSLRIIRLRIAASKAYWRMYIQKLGSGKDKPGGV